MGSTTMEVPVISIFWDQKPNILLKILEQNLVLTLLFSLTKSELEKPGSAIFHF